jgi:hypothetical protein
MRNPEGGGLSAGTGPQSSNGPSLASRAAGRAAARGGQRTDQGATDVKTRRIVGYVAVAFAYAYGCGSSPVPSVSPSTGADSGAAESGDDAEEDSRGLTVTDARARDERESDGASGGSEGGGAVDGPTYVPPSSNSSQSCCVNGAYYFCPNTAALAQCASACTHDPTYDSTCALLDAGSSSGVSVQAPPPPAPPTNACGGSFIGVPCMSGGQCYGSGEHCISNSCYPNDVGNPCTYPNECGAGNHCMNGCCQSPAKGSPCEAFWDCKSKTCTNNVCE